MAAKKKARKLKDDEKYLVIPVDDVKYLTDEQAEQLADILATIEKAKE